MTNICSPFIPLKRPIVENHQASRTLEIREKDAFSIKE